MKTIHILAVALALALPAAAQDFDVLRDTRPKTALPAIVPVALPTGTETERVLIAGDSWAQYMWDDGSHDDLFDRFGFADHRAVSLSLPMDPGPGHTGPEVAVSGSEARHWVDTGNYPWLANTTALLQAHPDIDRVILSIGGNDVLAGRSEGGWYKDMDLDEPGSEQALFDRIRSDTFTIIESILAVRPTIEVILSSYDYPNFNTGIFCFLYACPKREDLSRDPGGDLITDEELNGMMVGIELRRREWVRDRPRVRFDNSVGYMHHAYGDGDSAPRVLPRPGHLDPDYLPLPGGNSARPSLRANFRNLIDPIHLDLEGYRHKIGHQMRAHLADAFRGAPDLTLVSDGTLDGWADGVSVGTDALRVGDDGTRRVAALMGFDTSALPAGAVIETASLFLTRLGGVGANPFVSGHLGAPVVDVAGGWFGASPLPEPGDLTATADAVDAATVVGSIRADGYTLRLDLDGTGLAAIDPHGSTQLRLSFPTADPTADRIDFHAGTAGDWMPDGPATLAELLGSARPILDLSYSLPLAALGDTPVGPRLDGPTPNPFNPRTELRLHLAREGRLRVTVHDLRGRRIRTLADADRGAGEVVVVWDGRDDSGRDAGSGSYMFRIETAGAVTTRRGMLIR